MEHRYRTSTDLIAQLAAALEAGDVMGVFYAQTALVEELGDERALAVAAELLARAGWAEDAAAAEALLEERRRHRQGEGRRLG
ncbi:MAG: hypothetical protein HGA65_05210 [Oscillochloris sp.]|nr:hypothetical protein [Oscillochloris sp.]